MNKKLYGNILNSIDIEVKNAVNEQFNINDIDFSNDDETDCNPNIFNKEIQTYYTYYLQMLNGDVLTENAFTYMDTFESVIKPNDKEELKKIIEYYSEYYTEGSLNWLDVSDFTEMTQLFFNSQFNGDISRWDVSGVADMEQMFGNSEFNNDISCWDVSNVYDMSQMFTWSKFNKNISGWDVSNVVNMNYMFMYSSFNQDISGWDVSNVKYYRKIFENCNIYYKYRPKRFRY